MVFWLRQPVTRLRKKWGKLAAEVESLLWENKHLFLVPATSERERVKANRRLFGDSVLLDGGSKDSGKELRKEKREKAFFLEEEKGEREWEQVFCFPTPHPTIYASGPQTPFRAGKPLKKDEKEETLWCQ